MKKSNFIKPRPVDSAKAVATLRSRTRPKPRPVTLAKALHQSRGRTWPGRFWLRRPDPCHDLPDLPPAFAAILDKAGQRNGLGVGAPRGNQLRGKKKKKSWTKNWMLGLMALTTKVSVDLQHLCGSLWQVWIRSGPCSEMQREREGKSLDSPWPQANSPMGERVEAGKKHVSSSQLSSKPICSFHSLSAWG